MILLVEIQIPDDLHLALLISFGITTALVVSLMLISMLTSASVSLYDTVGRAIPFKRFWEICIKVFCIWCSAILSGSGADWLGPQAVEL